MPPRKQMPPPEATPRRPEESWLDFTVKSALETYDSLPDEDRGVVYVFVANFPSGDLGDANNAVSDVENRIRYSGELLIGRGFVPAFTTIVLGD